jgi:cation transport ATPase
VRRAEESAYAGIVRLVEQAHRSKAPMVRLADRYAILFLAVTVAMAGLAWGLSGDPVRAVAVLVVATPCPLILAVPVALVAGLSRAAKQGILIKGAKAIETMARIAVVVLDKTGTLTEGRTQLIATDAVGSLPPDEVLRLGASLDQASKHTIAQTIVAEARSRGLSLALPCDVAETAGDGVEGVVEDRRVVIGGAGFVAARLGRERLDLPAGTDGALSVADGELAGVLTLADRLRAGTGRFLDALRALGVDRILLATGDRHRVAEATAKGLPFTAIRVRAQFRREGPRRPLRAQARAGDDGGRRRQRRARARRRRSRRGDGRARGGGLGGGGRRRAPGRPSRPAGAGPRDRAAGAADRAAERDSRARPVVSRDDCGGAGLSQRRCRGRFCRR